MQPSLRRWQGTCPIYQTFIAVGTNIAGGVSPLYKAVMGWICTKRAQQSVLTTEGLSMCIYINGDLIEGFHCTFKLQWNLSRGHPFEAQQRFQGLSLISIRYSREIPPSL